jgi:hypothetical protein
MAWSCLQFALEFIQELPTFVECPRQAKPRLPFGRSRYAMGGSQATLQPWDADEGAA